MTAKPAQTVESARRRRQVALGVLRSLATIIVLVGLYYLLPLSHLASVPLAVILVVGLLVLLAVAAWQLGQIGRSRYPGVRAAEAKDSSWLAQCFERGAVRPCFVPDPEFRIIRLHTRYRRDLTDERTRERNRTEKLLESAAIKLSSVITDLHGVTGRDIMDHLIAGNATPRYWPSWPAPGPAARSPRWSTPWRARSSSPPSTPPCSRPCWSASTASPPRSASCPR